MASSVRGVTLRAIAAWSAFSSVEGIFAAQYNGNDARYPGE
jgi:hypothetical protein